MSVKWKGEWVPICGFYCQCVAEGKNSFNWNLRGPVACLIRNLMLSGF